MFTIAFIRTCHLCITKTLNTSFSSKVSLFPLNFENEGDVEYIQLGA